jgi:hypothetical protein
MKRNARKEKNFFFLASKLNSHSMLQLSLFPALHNQASNQIHLYLQEEREREREHARMITDPANNKIPFTTPFFPPAHSTEEQIPISRREGQEQHTCMHTKKRKWETKQKKISKEMCCGVFHQKIQNIPTATKNNRDIVEITKFKVRIWH